MGPGGGLVVAGVVPQAAVEDADQPVGQGLQAWSWVEDSELLGRSSTLGRAKTALLVAILRRAPINDEDWDQRAFLARPAQCKPGTRRQQTGLRRRPSMSWPTMTVGSTSIPPNARGLTRPPVAGPDPNWGQIAPGFRMSANLGCDSRDPA